MSIKYMTVLSFLWVAMAVLALVLDKGMAAIMGSIILSNLWYAVVEIKRTILEKGC